MAAPMFDPTTLSADADPRATVESLRNRGDVVPAAHGFVVIVGHGAASEALRHPDLRSGPIGELYRSSLPEGAARTELGHRINFLDPPDHGRVRGVVNSVFTPRRVAALRPTMEAIADDLLDALEGRLEVDLLGEVAHQLPSLVISELLGVPAADRSFLTGLSDRVAPLLGLAPTPEERADAIEGAERFHEYLGHLLDERRRAPGDDLLSALLAAEADGERLDHAELVSLAATLYSAGHRTTRDSFVNGVVHLLEAGHWADVVGGRWPMPDVVAELIRLETPTWYVARVPAVDVTLGGVEVAAGSPVLVMLAAANRDPAAYGEPADFRPGRTGPPALSFAFGAHFCLGASLARSEVEVMLTAVAGRWPHLRLADGATVDWHLRGPFRGVDRLAVAVG